MKRFGSVIQLKPEKVEEYKRLHRDVWPEVNAMIRKCHIQNYSIYYRDGYLFSYFEYMGQNYEADMQQMESDPFTQKWWEVCKPCQQTLETCRSDEWWGEMEEVYHLE